MTQFYVYVHTKPSGEIFYVGKGDRKRSKQFTKRNFMHLNIVAKYGRENIGVFAFPCESEAVALADEILTIAQLRREGCTLANFTDGGEGTTGHVKTAEQRANLSAKLKGKVRTVEQNAAQSVMQRARVRLPEDEIARGLKISAANKGRARTEKELAGRAVGIEKRTGLKRTAEFNKGVSERAVARLNTPDKVAARNVRLAIREQIAYELSLTADVRKAERYAKQGADRKGKKMPPTSDELRAKRAIARFGYVHTEETKAKIAAAHLGKVNGPQTPEHKAKLLESNAKGRLLRAVAKLELKCDA